MGGHQMIAHAVDGRHVEMLQRVALAHRFHFLHDVLILQGQTVKHLSLRGQYNFSLPLAALQQGTAQPFFQRFDADAQRGLRNVQFFSSF